MCEMEKSLVWRYVKIGSQVGKIMITKNGAVREIDPGLSGFENHPSKRDMSSSCWIIRLVASIEIQVKVPWIRWVRHIPASKKFCESTSRLNARFEMTLWIALCTVYLEGSPMAENREKVGKRHWQAR